VPRDPGRARGSAGRHPLATRPWASHGFPASCREREREAKHHGAYGVDISVDTPWWRTSSSSARPGLLPASWEGLGFHLVAGSGPAGRAHGQGNKGQWKSRNGGAGQTGGRETRNHAHGSPRGADATKCRARHLGEGRTTSALERTHITLTS
jgi:hypothetical protein